MIYKYLDRLKCCYFPSPVYRRIIWIFQKFLKRSKTKRKYTLPQATWTLKLYQKEKSTVGLVLNNKSVGDIQKYHDLSRYSLHRVPYQLRCFSLLKEKQVLLFFRTLSLQSKTQKCVINYGVQRRGDQSHKISRSAAFYNWIFSFIIEVSIIWFHPM